MQETISHKIEGIEAKVRQLAGKLHALQIEHSQLQKEYKSLQGELIKKNTKLFELEKRTKALPLAQQTNRTEELKAKQLKKEIAQYIKEIDKCIEWLKNS